ADSDTSDILVAVGLNSFFTGSNAGDIDVRETLAADPDLVSASITGASGEGANALRMLSIGDDKSLPTLGGNTLAGFLGKYTADVGFDSKRSMDLEDAQQSLVDDLVSRREEVSGVSMEEEMANLVRFQQQFQAAGRYIQTVQDLSGSLLEILQ
ncbi:MAG TPA: flagellar basal body rod C-terminal domain-containing protein, partial [Planctomycetota bacterium]|nr:flagellar basal body rod C-terminal domain-containing protein [Planctomycetota bacterium]